ncbi:hypothetical protein [Methylobacterium oxalidis]|uniref:hypothetical protein n=1 Tax=Methylobacterium oxalidis TaxID=944322 RepID=UPI003315440E
MVEERRAKHPEKKAWVSMEARWDAQTEICAEIANNHGPMNRYKREGANEIKKLRDNVEPREVVDTVLAMYLMYELEPRRFFSDQAFWTQLVRRVRGLTRANSGTWTDPETGKPKSAAKEIAPRVSEVVVFYIKEALGVCGVWMADLERKEEERKRQEVLDFYAELKELA